MSGVGEIKAQVYPPTRKSELMDHLINERHDFWELNPADIQKITKVTETDERENWKGKLYNNIHVVIYTLQTTATEKERKRFLEDVQVKIQYQNSKFVRLYGVCTLRIIPFVVTECLPWDSLSDYLRKQEKIDHFSIATQLSNALQYLEAKKLVHLDLKTKHVVVGPNTAIKLLTFGLVKKLENGEYHLPTDNRCHGRFAAPEVNKNNILTTKANVWTFGEIIYEIFSDGRVPFSGLRNIKIKSSLRHGLRPTKPKHASDSVYDQMLKCWHVEPEQRPSFETLWHFFMFNNPVKISAESVLVQWEIDLQTLSLGDGLPTLPGYKAYEATYLKKMDVAVTFEPSCTPAFLREVMFMTRVQHRNLLRLLAVCQLPKGMYKVTELMASGTLQAFLQSEVGKGLELAGQIDISAQIACGMYHLERHRLVLNNLKAENVLVGTNNLVKIADFSRAAAEGRPRSKSFKLSDDWKGDVHTITTDIIDYGNLLLEIMIKEDILAIPNDIEDVIRRCKNKGHARPRFHELYYFFDDYFVRQKVQEQPRVEQPLRSEPTAEIRMRPRQGKGYVKPSLTTDVVEETHQPTFESISEQESLPETIEDTLPALEELQVSVQLQSTEPPTGIQEASGVTEPQSPEMVAVPFVDELSQSEDFALEDWRLYDIKSSPRGLCVIINNREFYPDPTQKTAKDLPTREGTDKDKGKLKKTFTRLGFKVEVYDNQTDTQILQIINCIALEDHKAYDCFVCCVLTHGDQGVLYGCNGIAVSTRDCTVPFRTQVCKDLAGKPKMFFIQACQGSQRQGGYLQTDAVADALNKSIPNESDYLIGCSTVPGYVSYRHKKEGSWYISKLTEALDKDGNRADIVDILTQVNDAVADLEASETEGGLKQIPLITSTLRKKVIFGPYPSTEPTNINTSGHLVTRL